MPHATQHADVATVATAELDTALRGGPFHVALRAAIAARGLPLQRVQHHLSRYGVKVGVTSLSYWQQGARRPQRPESLRAVRALEEILQLPDESLIRLLARSEEPSGPGRDAGRSYRSLVEASGVLEHYANLEAACREVGRDPAEIQRTAGTTVLVPDAGEAPDSPPHAMTGSVQQLAEQLWAFHTEGGVSHLTVILDPWTVRGIEAFGKVIETIRSFE